MRSGGWIFSWTLYGLGFIAGVTAVKLPMSYAATVGGICGFLLGMVVICSRKEN